VLLIAVTAVASVVTPAVMPTALMVQKTAIAIAAIVLANSLPGDQRPFIMLTLNSSGTSRPLLGACANLAKLTEFFAAALLASN
jgi:hypothetical protein